MVIAALGFELQGASKIGAAFFVVSWLLIFLVLYEAGYLDGRRRKQPVIVLVLFALFYGGCWWWLLPKPDVIEHKIDVQNQKLEEQQKKLDEQTKKLDEITKLLKEQNPQATPDQLQKKYSHGYTIVKLNQTGPATPYDSHLLDGWKVNWDVARVRDLGNGMVEVRWPDFTFPGGNTFTGVRQRFTKTVGPHIPLVITDNVAVIAEVLAVAPDGVVVVLGFKAA